MKKLIVILFLVMVHSPVFSQILLTGHDGELNPGLTTDSVDIADIDLDGIADTLFYDPAAEEIVFLLSSLHYEPLRVEYFPELGFTTLYAADGGMSLEQNHMRAGYTFAYRLEPSAYRLRLAAYSGYSYGNALNDQSGEFLLDLEEGLLSAMWSYWDYELDSLITVPVEAGGVECPATYFDSPEDYTDDIVYGLLNRYQLRYASALRTSNIPEEELDLGRNRCVLPTRRARKLGAEHLLVQWGMPMYYNEQKEFVMFEEGEDVDTYYREDFCPRMVLLDKSVSHLVYMIKYPDAYSPPNYVLYYRDRKPAGRHLMLYCDPYEDHSAFMIATGDDLSELPVEEYDLYGKQRSVLKKLSDTYLRDLPPFEKD